MKKLIPFNSLWVGDRFRAHGNLWTYLGSGTARQHSRHSIQLHHSGHGYTSDTICSFEPNEQVEFVPPNAA